MKKSSTLEEFIKKAENIHGNKYDYSKSIYEKSRIKIEIICRIHGSFYQTPNDHLMGCGCPMCSGKKKTTETFIEAAKKIHNNRFDYSKTIYTKGLDKVIIICPEHGEFLQTPKDHLTGRGCLKCRNLTNNEFISKAKQIHGDKYDYSITKYINTDSPVNIICPEHGKFTKIARYHVTGNCTGCPSCSMTKGELIIYNWLKKNNIKFKYQFELITPEIARNTNVMIVDFFVIHNEKQYFIEYDGIQHFEYVQHFHRGGIIDFEKQQRRDKVLNEFCELHKDKVTLIRFDYKQIEIDIIDLLDINILKE